MWRSQLGGGSSDQKVPADSLQFSYLEENHDGDEMMDEMGILIWLENHKWDGFRMKIDLEGMKDRLLQPQGDSVHRRHGMQLIG
jgi:hypothetical protein